MALADLLLQRSSNISEPAGDTARKKRPALGADVPLPAGTVVTADRTRGALAGHASSEGSALHRRVTLPDMRLLR